MHVDKRTFIFSNLAICKMKVTPENTKQRLKKRPCSASIAPTSSAVSGRMCVTSTARSNCSQIT